MYKLWPKFGNMKIILYFLCPCLDCQNSNTKGDGVCDDRINIEECEYDGGDCCGSNVNDKRCSVCQCLDPNYSSGVSSSE